MKKFIYGLMSVLVAVGVALAEGDVNDPATPHDPGIYYYSEAGGEKKMTKIEPQSYGETKGGFAFYGGFGQTAKSKAVIEGANAAVQITEPRPTFYFYFAQAATGLGENVTIKPDDFVLSKMDIKKNKNERRLVVGKTGVYSGAKSGANKKDMRGFDVADVSPGVYKITVAQDLAPAEYCFFRPIGGAGTIFGFGIAGAAK